MAVKGRAHHSGAHPGLFPVRSDLYLLGADQDGHRSRGRAPEVAADLEPAEGGNHELAVEGTVDQVGVPDEAGELAVHGIGVDVLRRPELGDRTGADHGYLVGDRQRLVLVVGHQDSGRPRGAQDGVHIGTHRGPEVGVERRERLVEQDDLGLDGEGAGEGHSLLLAARELVGVAAGQAGQAYGIEQVGHLTAALAAGKPEGDVRSHVEVGEKASFLGHIADPAPLRGDVTAVVVDGGPRDGDRSLIRPLETGQNSQERCLAAPGRPEHGGEGPGGDLEVDARQDTVGPEPFVQVGDDDFRRQARGRSREGPWSCRPGGAAREPVEVAPQHVARGGGDGDDHEGEGRRLPVREVLLVGPKLGGEGLHTRWDQDQGGGELGDRGQEHQAERGGEAGSDQRERHPGEHGQGPLPERARHLLQGRGAYATDARTPTRARGKNKML